VVLTWLGPANFFILETSDGFGSPWQAVLAIQEESEGSTQVLWQIQPGPALFRLRQ
jgi:hypothetical protein